MSNINTGGPAFPVLLNPGQSWQGMSPCDGMTLRDYFAAKAMQSFLIAACTEENSVLTVLNKAKTDVDAEDWISYSSYEMADAMLKARDA